MRLLLWLQIGLGDYSVVQYYHYLVPDDNHIVVYNAKNNINVHTPIKSAYLPQFCNKRCTTFFCCNDGPKAHPITEVHF